MVAVQQVIPPLTRARNDHIFNQMTISVTEFKAHCLRILREVERSNRPVEISKQGRVRYRIVPVREPEAAPWMRLRSHGLLTACPEESVMSGDDWEASR